MFKYTTHTLKKLEEIFKEGEYIIRYERGNFTAGYCILESKKVVVVNKYFSLEARINCLLDILPKVNLDEELLSEKSAEFLKKNKLSHMEQTTKDEGPSSKKAANG